MSTKRFCDFCGDEIESDRSHAASVVGETTLRRKDSHRPHHVQVSVTVKFEENDGKPDMCSGCVFGAVHQIDPTPREADGG